ncbi:MAG: sugar phosphate isomerase/epimerase [Chloroflexota bacterium]|nr:sugar phosphate isomerase/epimerase [Chloroflexota bacterium]
MLLGIDSFSLRWQGWDAFQLMEYAAGLGLQNVHFSERANLESLETPYLESIRSRAGELGLRIEIGMRSFERHSTTFDPALGTGEEQLAAMVRAANVVGSPIVRCFLGMQADRMGDVPFDQHIAEAVRTLRAAAPLAEDLGITIAIENHGGVDLLATELRALIEAIGSEFVRVCLDTGNPPYAAEDAVLAAEILAPYIVTTHLRDTRIWATEDGAMVQWAPMGEGNVDLRRIVEIVERHTPDSAMDLEIITGVAPKAIPYFDPASDFWRMYPEMRAQDFARFVALAQSGAPEPLDQLCLEPGTWAPPAAQLDAFRAQQRDHFERSVTYCREVLGLGR